MSKKKNLKKSSDLTAQPTIVPVQMANIPALPATPKQAAPISTSTTAPAPAKPRTVNDDLREIFEKAKIDPLDLKQQVLARATFPKQWILDLNAIATPMALSIARILEYHNAVTENYRTNSDLTQSLRSILSSHPLIAIPAQTLDQEYKILAQCTAELRAIGVRTTVEDKVRIKTSHRLPAIEDSLGKDDDKSASLLQQSLKEAWMFRPVSEDILQIHRFSPIEEVISRKPDTATIMLLANQTTLPPIMHISWAKTAALVSEVSEIADSYQASFPSDFSNFTALVNAPLDPPHTIGDIKISMDYTLPRWAARQDCAAYDLGLKTFEVKAEQPQALNEIEEIFGLGRLIPASERTTIGKEKEKETEVTKLPHCAISDLSVGG